MTFGRAVEIFAVIVILIVVVMMVSPFSHRHHTREDAKQRRCMNNQRQIGLNVLNYNQSEGSNRYFPTGSAGEGADDDIVGRQFVVALWNPQDQDLCEKKIYVCPSNPSFVTPTPGCYTATGESAYTPGRAPYGATVDTNYYGWDEVAARKEAMKATKAGTSFVLIMDQDASAGSNYNNHSDGANCLYGDGHVEFNSFEKGFKDASTLTTVPKIHNEPTAILAAGKTKIVLPAHPGTWTRGWSVNFITTATGKPTPIDPPEKNK